MRFAPSCSSLHFLLPAVLAALAAPAGAQTSYTEEAATNGLAMVHSPAPGHPSTGMVGGGSVGDFNNDGLPDVFVFSGGSGPDYLFINQGGGQWQDQAAAWGLTDAIYGIGSAVGDFARDGWLDLYVTSWGDPVLGVHAGDNRLYRNNGNGSFTDVAAAAGVQFGSTGADSYGACWGDYDLDGWLDLFVSAYGPVSTPNRLYRNNGDGTFSDTTAAAGLTGIDSVHGLACQFTDFDGDRYPELVAVGDTGTSRYYVNNGDGTFTDSTATVQDLDKPNGMGIATGDFDQDGDIDFYVSDIYWALTGLGGNRLYWNQGGHVFTEGAKAAGCDLNGWGWGIAANDLDNDGWTDLATTNGWAGSWAWYPTRLFYNNGNATFTDIAGSCGINYFGQGRGLLRLDGDRDGDEDLLLLSSSDASQYYRNDLANGYGWFDLELDTSGHSGLAPNGYGTTVRAVIGGTTHQRQLDSNQSYLGQSELSLHFGLGGATQIDALEVEWADGFTTRISNLPANQRLVVAAAEPYELSPVIRGQTVTMTLRGCAPGDTTGFLFSTRGAGASPPVGALGGMRLGILPPFAIRGPYAADAAGVASFSQTVPMALPPGPLWSQAVVQRGPGGAESLASNVVATTIQ